VDDGAKTPEDTIAMARVAAENGTKVILATPHRKDITENWSVPYITELKDDMNRRIKEAGIDLTFVLGMENHLDTDLPDEYANGRALPMNGTRYMLVEMPFFGRPNYIEDAFFRLQAQGVIPVLAHPERIEAFQKEPELLRQFVEQGMLSQVTGGSFLGYFGGSVQKFTTYLMKRGLVHIIASDTHFPNGPRSPKLPPCVEAASKILGEEEVRQMVVDRPKAILEGQIVEVDSPKESVDTRKWWQFWKAGD
jgi:protein-tyrosine phosphatase